MALPPLLDRQIALHQNFGQIGSAIMRGELRSVLPLTGEEQVFYWHRPLIRRVIKEDFLQWASHVGLKRTLPWPDRVDIVRPGRRRKKGGVEVLELKVVNAQLRAMKAVAQWFRQRYRVGGLSTPTAEEVGRFLVDVRGEPPNIKRAEAIARFLAPESIPPGPRHRKEKAVR